jgi:hypothetical protein
MARSPVEVGATGLRLKTGSEKLKMPPFGGPVTLFTFRTAMSTNRDFTAYGNPTAKRTVFYQQLMLQK